MPEKSSGIPLYCFSVNPGQFQKNSAMRIYVSTYEIGYNPRVFSLFTKELHLNHCKQKSRLYCSAGGKFSQTQLQLSCS